MIAPNNANKTRIPKKAATFFRFTLTIKVSSSSRSSLFRYKNEESITPPMISSGNRYGDLNIMVVRAATSATATENGVIMLFSANSQATYHTQQNGKACGRDEGRQYGRNR